MVISSGKHLEKVENLHPVCIMYRLLTSSHLTSRLMYGFEESENTGQLELTNHEKKGTFFVRNKLTDIIEFADEEKSTNGLGFTLTLKRNNNSGDPIVRRCCKSRYKRYGLVYSTLYLINEHQHLVMNQILDNDRIVYYTERSVFRKDVDTNKNFSIRKEWRLKSYFCAGWISS